MAGRARKGRPPPSTIGGLPAGPSFLGRPASLQLEWSAAGAVPVLSTCLFHLVTRARVIAELLLTCGRTVASPSAAVGVQFRLTKKPRCAGLFEALLRTRTADPLLTMRSSPQAVASYCGCLQDNRNCLAAPPLRTTAAGCDRWAPQRLHDLDTKARGLGVRSSARGLAKRGDLHVVGVGGTGAVRVRGPARLRAGPDLNQEVRGSAG